jgi:hypothetical protein
MGASRSRLNRHLLAARWGVGFPASLTMGMASMVKRSLTLTCSPSTAGVSARSGILLGLAAALRSIRMDLGARVKGAARPRLSFGFANGLVVFQSSVLRQHYV